MYCPGDATCSARPIICQVRLNTVFCSTSAIRASVYQAPGMVEAVPSGSDGTKVEIISCMAWAMGSTGRLDMLPQAALECLLRASLESVSRIDMLISEE